MGGGAILFSDQLDLVTAALMLILLLIFTLVRRAVARPLSSAGRRVPAARRLPLTRALARTGLGGADAAAGGEAVFAGALRCVRRRTPSIGAPASSLLKTCRLRRRMLAKVYRELMILGFISFGVVVCGVRDLLPPGLCPAAARPPRNAEMSVWVGRRRSST
eukprot:COSAG04_NODE_508_length_13301_cov_9.662198_11_plen_162_part_00